MVFKNPILLTLLPLIFGVVFILKRNEASSAFRFPTADIFNDIGSSWKMRWRFLPFILRLIVLALFIVALAGPRKVLEESKITTEGIDIVLVLDASGSMAAQDFVLNGKRQSRLEVVKKVVAEFIDQRPNDKIGLVVFAAQAFTASPLTTDHAWLKENLARVELGVIDPNRTAIGSGISSAVLRLKKSQAKSKIIILLTDGVSNAGKVDPLSAARAAQTFGIKVYTIGAGVRGMAPVPVQDFFGRISYQNQEVEIDEEMLQEVARLTGGKYYRATATEELQDIYKDIDQLEKTKIEEVGYKEYKEMFGYILSLALVLLMLEAVLKNTFFLKIP